MMEMKDDERRIRAMYNPNVGGRGMREMNYDDAQRIREKYNHNGVGDIAVGPEGEFVYVTWAEYALLEMVEELEARIETLELERGQSAPDGAEEER